MKERVFSGEGEVAAIGPGNRGLAYGDGLFESMRVDRGGVPLWPRHLARLRAGADRLGIAVPDAGFVQARVAELVADCAAGVLKLLLTRGQGGRGYAPQSQATPEWLLSLHPLPAIKPAALRLHMCETRLAIQPALAGIKHCNRLEQVLARAECERVGCDEGLMQDTAGNVACATAANVLVLRNGAWSTPPVTDCGVAGVLREWLLEHRLVAVAPVSAAQVECADALALCNAVRGILPVASLGVRAWRLHPAVAQLQAGLARAYPMFSESMEVA
ncbi:MAG: aminodeoxychorismate lyase [Pseudomonadota bacterium]